MKFSTGLCAATLLASSFTFPLISHAEDSPPPRMPCWQAAGDTDKAIDTLQANLRKMDAQLEKLRQTKDQAARQPLLQEYAATMGDTMCLSHSLGAYPMMYPGHMMGYGGYGMMGYGMGGYGMMGGRMPMDPNARIEQMEKRLELMQKRLDQLKKTQSAPTK